MKIALLTTILFFSGCGMVPRPNEPSTTRYIATETTKPDGSKVKTIEVDHEGTENEVRSAPVKVCADGSLHVGEGRSVSFDWDIGVSDAYIWIGAVVAVIGLVLMFAPIPVPFVKSLGLPLAIGGTAFACLPIVADQLRALVMIAGIVGMAAAAVYGLWKSGKLKTLLSDGIKDRTAKGDADGAASLAFVAAGGDKEAARKAKEEAKLHVKPPAKN